MSEKKCSIVRIEISKRPETVEKSIDLKEAERLTKEYNLSEKNNPDVFYTIFYKV